MNPIAWPDALWERIKERHPHLKLADQTYDQSHMHHTLVCVLGFGMIGWAFQHTARGFAAGVIGGWTFYAGREIVNRLEVDVSVPWWKLWWWRVRFVPFNIWDAMLDVIVPVFITGPWVMSALGAPAWAGGVLMFALAAYVAWEYTVGRPPNTLHYDRSKN